MRDAKRSPCLGVLAVPALLAVLALVACPGAGGGDGDVRSPEVRDVGADPVSVPDAPAADDTPGADTHCPGGHGCPCQQAGDCDSGSCVETMDGAFCGEPACTPGDPGCPPVYADSTLCRPCMADQDCIPPTGAQGKAYVCIDNGPEGRFCGRPCEASTDCPEYRGQAFDCVPVATGSGDARQCRPTSGTCPCTPKYRDAGYVTECWVRNGIGRCTATRTCDQPCNAKTPEAESCNLADDDCNGLVDDDVQTCPLGTNCEGGHCSGPCGGDADCDDGNPCTVDTCDSATGGCVFAAIGGSCVLDWDCSDDHDPCTIDRCIPRPDWAGQCPGAGATVCAYVPISCDDGNPATADSCDPDLGCVHAGTPP